MAGTSLVVPIDQRQPTGFAPLSFTGCVGAEAIVAFNQRHFPRAVLESLDVTAVHPANYLVTLYGMDSGLFVSKLEAIARNRGILPEQVWPDWQSRFQPFLGMWPLPWAGRYLPFEAVFAFANLGEGAALKENARFLSKLPEQGRPGYNALPTRRFCPEKFSEERMTAQHRPGGKTALHRFSRWLK